jgi:hypothetical protein
MKHHRKTQSILANANSFLCRAWLSHHRDETPTYTSFTSFHLYPPPIFISIIRIKLPNMVLILFALYIFLAIAAPVANLTTLQTVIAPAWVADPAGRGTWSLLYSCLFTLLLCVYIVIHINVPSPNDTNLTFWLRKTK